MAVRRTFAGRQVQRQKAGTNWSRVVSAVQITIAASSKVLLTSFSLDNPGIMETVRRTRGKIMVSADVAGVEPRVGAFGLIVINDVAKALGVTGIPGPVTDADNDDWFVWEPFGAITAMIEGAGSTTGNGPMVFEFDSKAMRRIPDGSGVAVMVENASGTTGLKFWFGMSILSSRA